MVCAKFRYTKYFGSKQTDMRKYGPYGPYFYQGRRKGKSVVFRYLGRSVEEVAESLRIDREEAFKLCIASLLRVLESSNDSKVKAKVRSTIQELISQSR